MVYVVTLRKIIPRNTRMEVYECYQDALQRAAIWAGMNEQEALITSIDELEKFVVLQPTCAIQCAEFFPQLPQQPTELIHDSQ